MKIAILTFDGFNEIDSFVASGILNRMRNAGWRAEITCPAPSVTSMNGATVHAQRPPYVRRVLDGVRPFVPAGVPA